MAFDIVLLPEKNFAKRIVGLNNSLIRNYGNKRIVLNENYCLPHISLLMGAINSKYLSDVKERLDYLSSHFLPLEFISTRRTIENLPSKDRILKIVGLEIERTEQLMNLHKSVVDGIKHLLSDSDITKEMMYNPKEIESEDTPWMFSYIKNFMRDSSYNKFNPHITIGDGVLEQKLNLPIKFESKSLVIGHLGNYCTVGKIL